ncbi:hypothetical protein INR49_016646, partial [Caranx melampygus]
MLRKAQKPGSKLRWKLLRVSTDVNEASVPCEATAVRATIRKYIRREQKRAQLVKLAKVLERSEEGEKGDGVRGKPRCGLHEQSSSTTRSNGAGKHHAVPDDGALDAARPVGSAPEPCVAPPAEERTKRTSALVSPRIVKSRSPLPGHGGSAVRSRRPKEVGHHVTDI